jgi:hypothetical protein
MVADIGEGAQRALGIPRQQNRAADGVDRAPGAGAPQLILAPGEEPVFQMDAADFLGEDLGRGVVAFGQAAGEAERLARPDEAVRLSG